MIGINIGVAAPMAFFPFGGSKQSFFGDLKAAGSDGIRFFTDQRVVISSTSGTAETRSSVKRPKCCSLVVRLGKFTAGSFLL